MPDSVSKRFQVSEKQMSSLRGAKALPHNWPAVSSDYYIKDAEKVGKGK